MTAAFGARKYLEMAIDLGLSLKGVSSLPFSIVTTPGDAAYFRSHYDGVIDKVISVPSLENERGKGKYLAAKLECLASSPYDQSIFLDADLLCVRDPSFLFDGLQRGVVRVHGRLHDRESCGAVVHHGVHISEMIDKLALDAYTYSSLAVFAFDRAGGNRLASLMENERAEWDRRTSEHFGDFLYDEILLGVLGARSGVDFFWYPERSYQPLDMSFRWRGEFSFVHPGPMRNREAARVLYGIVTRRMRAHKPLAPALYWLSDIFNRRANEAGRSRRQARILREIVTRALDT